MNNLKTKIGDFLNEDTFYDEIEWIGEERFNSILDVVAETEDFNGSAELLVTNKDNIDYNGLFDSLIGWKFTWQQNGEHVHDGQMVEYHIRVYNENNKEVANFYENMCLMVGWNVKFR